MLKECRKDSLVYKMAALRCAGDVLQSSQEDRFSEVAEILFPLIKKVGRWSGCARRGLHSLRTGSLQPHTCMCAHTQGF